MVRQLILPKEVIETSFCYDAYMQLYRFSPIQDQAQLIEAVNYVAKEATKLYFRSTGNVYDELIKSLTIFTHYPDEYEKLTELAHQLGDPHNENNGPRVKLKNPIKVMNGQFEQNGELKSYHTSIQYLRIRKPDPYRMQVGCCDLEADFDGMDFSYVILSPNEDKSPRLITRPEYDMLEFFDPSIDVLAYVISGAKSK